ncbi:hypothetical protein [Polyangium sp. 6x1]|uniref:hypothetical protein n=1 Tax=Polyangium sp. 6x1 TaxID=3042689 RepID=UPI00248238B7|nr:hypothetical protein [Polyangium sp. 6x1]MDI1448424.1 hypothetical protein [Polyangium sp. 6x1]
MACSAGGGGEKAQTGGTAGGGQGGNGQGGGGQGGGIIFPAGGSGSGGQGGGKPAECDDAGNCTCINIASFGKPAHYGVGMDNTDAFLQWLNDKSSASVDLYQQRTTLTPELLAKYDVIILQALEDGEYGPFWKFSPEEIDAVKSWVSNGGGLITLTGYGGDAGEVDPTNELLAFAGASYNKDDILGNCPGGVPCYCWGNSVPMAQFSPESPISANIKQVGAFHGRSINSSGGVVVAGEGGTKFGVAIEVDKGRVFVFADEWVTYSSQWLGAPQQPPNPNDPCYDNAAGYWKTADKVFQVPQFWFNAIKWVSTQVTCFDIEDPGIIK